MEEPLVRVLPTVGGSVKRRGPTTGWWLSEELVPMLAPEKGTASGQWWVMKSVWAWARGSGGGLALMSASWTVLGGGSEMAPC